ncbi:nucleolar complex protein 3 [Sporothrix brasiliensis 5110]|uniref:Nucleolar complex-associated protein 3 n=1 Tax=Sporothrix brasiliensis 5110 TaxID=1398154 RepID=A0A0C2F211_9PEZI|nr:nucleolar complex protein 3 [Sporothrix brasiliensis 5110]KIH92974.1 nucleolar complex protein 3 [Sporothrix brasiliensis 5110]
MDSRGPKRRRVSPARAGGGDGAGKGIDKSYLKNAANWSLEENYAERSRKRSKKAEKAEKASDRLPIRTADGMIRPLAREPTDNDATSDDEDPFADSGDDVKTEAGKANGKNDGSGARKAAARIQEQNARLPERQQIQNAKEELAKLALKLNENPEENGGAFKALAQVSQQYTSIAVQKMCLATQLSVYKDVIPGYRIRAFGEEPPTGEKLSSDVRRIRAYEQSLLAGYQGYLRELMRLSKLRPSDAANKNGAGKRSKAAKNANSLADAALACACSLLNAVAHFNFREDLLKIIVGKLSTRRVDASFVKCRLALETLFREDDEGRPSMEAVAMLSKMMKARDYWVDESVPNTFLHLRLLSEFSGKGSQDSVERASDETKRKEKREFRTKRTRKLMKEQKALDRDMAQADALVAHEERERMQSETLKLVFATYFRILKLRTPHLMGAILEGLAKYAHLINQNFFGDVLEALKDLIRYSEEDAAREARTVEGEEDEAANGGADDEDDFAVSRNPSREALLCTVTAYALLAGQDAHNAASDLHLDLSFFTTNLFRSLYPLALSADIEKHANSLQQRLADAHDAASSETAAAAAAAALNQKNGVKVNLQTTTVLLIRCLTAVLLPHYNIRSVPPLRLAAFTKQLMAASLHVPEKSSQALLALLYDVAHTHSKKISALWNTEERKGDGSFNPLSETVEGSNPFAATVWEGELLRRHYCPKVREGIKALEKNLTI